MSGMLSPEDDHVVEPWSVRLDRLKRSGTLAAEGAAYLWLVESLSKALQDSGDLPIASHALAGILHASFDRVEFPGLL